MVSADLKAKLVVVDPVSCLLGQESGRMMIGIEKMSEVSFGREDIKKSIDKMKLGKQAGFDGIIGIKCEMYKWMNMNQSEICVDIPTY